VQIEAIGEPGIAGGIGRREIVDDHRRAIGADDALPDDEGALLAVGDDAVVLANQPRALRD